MAGQPRAKRGRRTRRRRPLVAVKRSGRGANPALPPSSRRRLRPATYAGRRLTADCGRLRRGRRARSPSPPEASRCRAGRHRRDARNRPNGFMDQALMRSVPDTQGAASAMLAAADGRPSRFLPRSGRALAGARARGRISAFVKSSRKGFTKPGRCGVRWADCSKRDHGTSCPDAVDPRSHAGNGRSNGMADSSAGSAVAPLQTIHSSLALPLARQSRRRKARVFTQLFRGVTHHVRSSERHR